MRFGDFITDIGGYVAFHPRMTKIAGSTNANVFLSSLVSWTGKERSEDGWIYKNSDEIELETGLSYKEQATARKHLISRGLLEEKNRRFEHKIYFRVVRDSISDAWESQKLDFAKVPMGISGKSDQDFRETTNGTFDPINTKLTIKHTSTKKSSASHESVINLWNQIVEGTPFSKIVSITGKRQKDLEARLKDPEFMNQFEPAIRYLLTQDWACGRSPDRNWVADFDYMVRDGIVLKYYEKSLSNRQIPMKRSLDPRSDSSRSDELDILKAKVAGRV